MRTIVLILTNRPICQPTEQAKPVQSALGGFSEWNTKKYLPPAMRTCSCKLIYLSDRDKAGCVIIERLDDRLESCEGNPFQGPFKVFDLQLRGYTTRPYRHRIVWTLFILLEILEFLVF